MWYIYHQTFFTSYLFFVTKYRYHSFLATYDYAACLISGQEKIVYVYAFVVQREEMALLTSPIRASQGCWEAFDQNVWVCQRWWWWQSRRRWSEQRGCGDTTELSKLIFLFGWWLKLLPEAFIQICSLHLLWPFMQSVSNVCLWVHWSRHFLCHAFPVITDTWKLFLSK